MRPARDVAFVLIRYAEGKPIDVHTPRLCEMKDVLMAVIQKSFRVDRFEMAERFGTAVDLHLALRVRLPGIATGWSVERIEVRVAPFSVDRNGFDPVNRVLQNKPAQGRQLDHNFMRQHRTRGRRADAQKKRSVRSENSSNLCRPFGAPMQIRSAILPVGILPVANSQVVRW